MTVTGGDALRVSARLSFGAGGQDLVNVMYFKLVVPATLPDAQVLTDMGEVLEVFYNTVLAAINNTITFQDYTVKDEDTDIILGTDTWPTLTVGSSIVDALPPQCAALVLARTVKSRKQGRVYIPGFADDQAIGSGWIAGALTALGNFAAEILVTHAATFGTYSYQVFTRPEVGPPLILAALDDPTTVAVVPFVRTQRSRSSFFGS